MPEIVPDTSPVAALTHARVTDSTCGLTVVVPQPPYSAVKAYERDTLTGWRKVRDYNAGEFFNAIEVSLRHLDELADLIASIADQNGFIVRGKLSTAAREMVEAHGDSALLNRRMHPRHRGDLPSFEDAPRHWIMVDVDHWRIPEDLNLLDIEDHEEIVDRLIKDLLHPAFHDARAFYQWSNSAGQVRNIAKVHIFFWLATPLSSREVRDRFAAHCPAIRDRSPYSAVQPHFIANPEFLSGSDPMPVRFGWRDGLDDEVHLPPLPPRPTYVPSASTSDGATGVSWLRTRLARIGDGPGLRGFHEPIRDLLWAYTGYVFRGALVRIDDQLISAISRRVRSAPARDDRRASDIDAYACPFGLQRQIDAAFSKRDASS